MTYSRAGLAISEAHSSYDSFQFPLEQQSACRRLTFAEKLLLALYICIMGFDFKGKPGGSPMQFVIVGICVFAAALLLTSTRTICRARRVERCVLFWWTFLIAAAFTSFINEVSPGNLGRVILPFFLFGTSLLVVRGLAQSKVHPVTISNYCLAAATISSVWTLFYGIKVKQPDLSEMRYQILSPLLYYLVCFGIAEALIFRQRLTLAWAGLIFALCVISLSVTRTCVLSLAAIVSLGVLVARHHLSRRLWARRILLGFTMVAVMSGVAFLTAIHLRPNTVAAWDSRFAQIVTTGVRADYTALTRFSEFAQQWDEIRGDPWSLFCGKGMGSAYTWRPKDYWQLLRLPQETTNCLGHSLYFSTVYVSGILFGWMVPALIVWAFWTSWRLVRTMAGSTNETARAIVVSSLFLFATLVSGLLGHPFTFRELGLFLGLIVGQIAWLADYGELQGHPVTHAR